MSESYKTIKRGYDPSDRTDFSGEAMAILHKAQAEIQWLLDRGYNMKSVINLTGNHYQLSSRQRTAIQRTTAAAPHYAGRETSRLTISAVRGGCLNIDGFNLIIILEVALSGSPVFLGKDDVLRDLAGLRGTYRLIDKTDQALVLIGKTLTDLSISEAIFYLDENVSNSGRLKGRILEYADEWGIPVEVDLVPDADMILAKMSNVVTGDSMILDECVSWLNLSRIIVDEYIKEAWIVDFCDS